ncbi:MAG: hypothetical protein KY453_05810 [Gemmatimonadetes bacterium]|nr:hypothetical protein [Gemmatimonadota bacterium]
MALPLILLAAAAAGSGACGAGEPPQAETIPRETFIATYVDLRKASLEGPGGPIDDGERQRVLEAHGVSEDDLLRFADVHGDDPRYMRELWDEIERRLQGPPPPDSIGASANAASGGPLAATDDHGTG